MTLPDQRARERIEEELDLNLLVEAGAGSGKTTALVGRLLGLVARGDAPEGLAAVTFTRKAAGELRERFQEGLEKRIRETPPSDPAYPRLLAGLASLDRIFMGTIHAFCARLLRERPLEAGLDPSFSELTAARQNALSREWWEEWLERLTVDGDPSLDELRDLGVAPERLFGAFRTLNESLDVEFPTPETPPPSAEDTARLREALEGFMERAEPYFPAEEPEKGWGPVQTAFRSAWFLRKHGEWEDPRVFYDYLARNRRRLGKEKLTLNRWPAAPQAAKKALRDDILEWGGEGGPVDRALSAWLSHRYPACLRFARRAAVSFGAFRRRTGQLSFHDLLRLTRDLLASSPEARRELGERFTQILVDEFQDTDPLQAEVLFLLTSADEFDESWLELTPRPGALFVVGDPKQSIYRFRRADIQLYQEVRERFDPERGGFGDILRLTANFRSVEEVAGLVNEVFQDPDRFPAETTARQAGFAPLVPHRTPGPEPRGVTTLQTPELPRGSGIRAHDHHARCLAGWVHHRLDGEREPGDFLILARTKRELHTYARELEAWGIPVEVSGARAGIQEEVRELQILLGALADPADGVKTLAALTGLFVGLDLDALLLWVEGGGRLDFRSVPLDRTHPAEAEAAKAAEGLRRLHRWWTRGREVPADVLVPEMVAELGLLPHAVGGELGGVRGGALTYALDLLRVAGLDGDTSLGGALDALATGLDDEDWEAPLEPGRGGAVRVMNLHKAKGLEAPVVVLVDPEKRNHYPARVAIRRGAHGAPEGWMEIGQEGSRRQFETLAAPPEWGTIQTDEEAFGEAEEVRLLYVAATRARDELVVLRPEGGGEKSAWQVFHAWLEGHGATVVTAPGEPPERPPLPTSDREVLDATRAAEEARRRMGEASYRILPVTRWAKETEEAEEAEVEADTVAVVGEGDSSGPGGAEWGSAVHAVLEAAARGARGEELRGVARSALVDRDRPMREGEPRELDLLLRTVDGVLGSEIWRRAQDAEVVLAEHPFLWRADPETYLEGVLDLAFRESGGWVIVDYKTDGDEYLFEQRLPAYRRQLERYGEAWGTLTGEPVTELLLFRVGGVPEPVILPLDGEARS